ncbi:MULTISPECIES: hypothetical protein [Thiorhodovibrio]|uniref:hypothetical protein n=1 Tax=Thiorhodovibrio TaxID=61593 RepID=UPI001912A722|nr:MULTISPECIES: hypothetical protein [Thiorhodovibrio]MBK5970065.1 hypothetical protein [Thiorhodovibrio winogradskyi]
MVSPADPEALAKQAVSVRSNPLNDSIRILAGLKVSESSPHADLMDSAAWQNYHQQIQRTWQRYNTQQHDKVESFRDQWLPPDVNQGRDLLYPFAGADFLYADLFFPRATNIYMFGLEPLGEIPGRERLNSTYYNGVIRSTEDLLRLTFFRTKAMREDFRHNGTVPLLSYFIVHRGHTIKDITYLRLDEDGIPHQAPLPEATGARIAFQDGRSGRMRHVWYWRGDLGNQAFANTPGLKHYVAGLPPSNLYMKAASYLCHHRGFEDACSLFRDRAVLSLQEDSGMPLRYFPEEVWDQTFFGQYREPISVFTDQLYRQGNALRNAFATAEQVHELPFPLGYHASARTDNLMLAVRKDQIDQQPVPPQQAPAPSAETEPPAQPAGLRQQLEAAGIAYKTHSSGTISLVQSVDNSRTQLTFIAPEPKPVGGLAMREIWSVGYLSDDDELSVDTTVQLLKENAATDQGAWELGQFLGKAAGIFRTRIPADANWQTLANALQSVSATADRKEQTLMGTDEL